MVKRYAHKALVTVESGHVESGEWIVDESYETAVTGQYFPSSSGTVKAGSDGEEHPVHGEFSTPVRPLEGAVRIRIESVCLDAKIICWEPFQSHSVIYV